MRCMICCSMLKKIKAYFPFIFSVFLVVLFYFKRFIVIKFYPPIMNFVIFLLFFCSIFSKETIIQKIALAIDGELSLDVRNYTRKLTYIWSFFLFCNFIVSLITIFLSDKIWIVYNGFISYFLVGLLFIMEYVYRTFLRGSFKC